jgi:2-C-methyl-D-erythritol 4-phosphate cytidylyltransferase
VVAAIVDGADGVVPVLPVTDTVKRVDGGRIVETVDRDALSLAQTPQAFRVSALRAAHAAAAASGAEVTDDAMLLEGGGTVVAVPGEPVNFKVTTMLDLVRARERMGAVHG